MIEQAETERARRLLIIVEGLDKVDLRSATSIFRDHAPTITAPNANMIYTFPLALRHSDEFNVIRLHFPSVEFLPNLRTHGPDGGPDEEGLGMLRDLLLARLDPALIEAEARERLLFMSGGIPVWLVVLVRNAALYALEREAAVLSREDVENAVRDLRRDTVAPLRRDDYAVLRDRHADRRFTNDEDERRLLYNGSLIEYPNDVPWCDAHPVLWPLLEETENGGAGRSG